MSCCFRNARHRHRLSQITVAEVDRYRDAKLREGHVMRLQEGDRERLKALVNGGVLAPNGTGAATKDPNNAGAQPSRNDETTGFPGASPDSWGETRTPDLTIMSRAL